MRNVYFGSFIAFSILLAGCSEDAVQKESTESEEIATEAIEEQMTEAQTETSAESTEIEEEETVEESTEVSEEVVNTFLAEYQDNSNNLKDSKKIAENTYQTMEIGERGEEVDTYTTWEFTPGETEPKKIFEKTFPRNAEGFGYARKSGDIADDFRVHDGFYVIEPITSLDEEVINAIKNGYLPFSDLRLGMTEEEAAAILPDPYEVTEFDFGATRYSGNEVSYYILEETGLVYYITTTAEAFSDNQKFEEIQALLGDEQEKGEYYGGEGTFYDFVVGDSEVAVTFKNGDEEWKELQITNSQ